MSKLEDIKRMKNNRNYTFEDIEDIADQMEQEIGEAGMWRNLRPCLELDELIENLECIAREADI